MFKKYDEAEWADNICEDLMPVLEFLKSHFGVRIEAVWDQNIKAPDTVIKLAGGLPANAARIATEKFAVNPHLKFDDKWISCQKHYTAIE